MTVGELIEKLKQLSKNKKISFFVVVEDEELEFEFDQADEDMTFAWIALREG